MRVHQALFTLDSDGSALIAQPLQDPFDVTRDSGAVDKDEPAPERFLPPPPGTLVNGLPVLSWDQAAAQLTRGGYSWNLTNGEPVVVTYAFRASAPTSEMSQLPAGVSGFSQFNAIQIAVVDEIMQLWSEVANIQFVRVGSGTSGPDAYSNDASILFGNFLTGPSSFSALTFLPSPTATGAGDVEGNIWVNVSRNYIADPLTFSLGAQIFVHEIGHALGLLHPADYDGGAAGGATYPNDATFWQDTAQFTTMSYFNVAFTGANWGVNARAPQLFDIAAAQLLYGVNTTTRTGDTVYGFNSNSGHSVFTIHSASEACVFTIWDAGGNDTIDLSGYTTNSEIDLREEAFSSAGPGNGGPAIYNIAIARGAVIENAIGGSGADTLIGNDAANTLSGGNGADTLTGGLGIDTINGGAGNDTIVHAIGDGNGSIDGGADIDTVNITDGAAESLLEATFNGAALSAVSGNGLSNVENINANMGGGTDWLIYAAASAAVAVNLATGSASGFTSIAGVERVIGGDGDDSLTGDGLDNRLDGGAGADTLSGSAGFDTLLGGDGADVLAGGLGNDSLLGGAGNDAFNWAVSEGRDTIDGGADTDTFNATGSSVAELGNASWNGSALTALMDNALSNIEAINLNLDAGVDWLIYNAAFAVTVDLSANSASGFASITNIEKVIGGSAGDTLTGDGLDNRLDGQGGNDTLDGGAGSDAVLGGDGDDVIQASAGNDSLQGQGGNDTFHWTSTDGRDTFNGGADVDTVFLTGSAGAEVADTNWNGSTITGLLNNALIDIENVHLDLGDGGPGGDWLRYNTSSAVSVDLGAGTATGFASIANVENLIGGTGGDTLTGDAGANKINANNGDDTITGGAGNDNLIGGLGNDVFVYAAGAGADTVNDFDAWDDGGQDLIDVTAFGITAGDFGARVAIIDTGADTVVRIDDDVFITLKNVTGDGDNSISIADFILA